MMGYALPTCMVIAMEINRWREIEDLKREIAEKQRAGIKRRTLAEHRALNRLRHQLSRLVDLDGVDAS